MRKLFLWTIFIFIMVLGLGCNESTRSSQSSNADVVDGNVRIYEVFGMDCPGCHSAVEKQVNKIPSVAQAHANWEAKKLTIVIKDNAEFKEEDVLDAIRRANFTPGKRLK